MSRVAERPHLSLADYLAWEAGQPVRHEYLAGEVFAMTGGTLDHNRLTGNLWFALRIRLGGTPCEVFASDAKVRVDAADACFYPDVVVTCSEADRRAEQMLREPRVIVEVLSPGTAAYDWGAKFEAYSRLPGLAEYVLVEAGRIAVHVLRPNAAGRWERWSYGAGAELELTSLGITIPMHELYAGIAALAAPGD